MNNKEKEIEEDLEEKEPEIFVKITPANNGYVVETGDGERIVFQEKDSEDETNKEHLIEMLWNVVDYFGETGSRYDKWRICVGYRTGDKTEVSKKEIKAMKEKHNVLEY